MIGILSKGAGNAQGKSLTTRFAVRGDHIRLDQLLKAVGLVSSGGEAHLAVEQGMVRVDGQLESRKRAKLRVGQSVSLGGETISLVADTEASPETS